MAVKVCVDDGVAAIVGVMDGKGEVVSVGS